MRPIGFSTGALAYADFRKGLTIITEMGMDTIELSALRISEWEPLLRALPTLDLSSFIYVSVHLPSKMNKEEELVVISSLEKWKDQFKWPLVLHPDAITDWTAWQRLGRTISIENMDMRKQIGRTEAELTEIFTTLPEASFCFDIGHAWQVDPTMSEAYWILKAFRDRLVQVHVSEVNSLSKHDSLSDATIQSFRKIAHMIPNNIPLILETPVSRDQIKDEMIKARSALTPTNKESQLVA